MGLPTLPLIWGRAVMALLVSNCISGLKASEQLQGSLHVRLHLHVTYIKAHLLFHLQAVEP
jgi:hypothetical protein